MKEMDEEKVPSQRFPIAPSTGSVFHSHTFVSFSQTLLACWLFPFLQFYVRVEEKLPAYNTRIRLPELQMRDGESGDTCACVHTETQAFLSICFPPPQTNSRKRRRVMSLPGSSWSASHNWLSSQSPSWPGRSPGKMKSSDVTQGAFQDSPKFFLYQPPNFAHLSLSGFKWVDGWKYKCECLYCKIMTFMDVFDIFWVTCSTSACFGATFVFSSSFSQCLN